MSELIAGSGNGNGQRASSESGLQFDATNFPVLSASSANGSSGGSGGGRFPPLSGPSQIRDEDFTIASEDFPALPGTQGPKSEGGLAGLGSSGLNGSSAPGPGSGQVAGVGRLRDSADGFGQHGQQLQPGLQSGNASGGQIGGGVGQPIGGGSSVGGGQQGSFSRGMGPSPISMGVPTGVPGGGLIGNEGVGGAALSLGGGGMAGLGLGPSSKVETTAGKDAKYGLSGLLDVIKMTDRVRKRGF